MSWFGGYKPKLSEPESRELRRQKLEAERLQRKQEREARQQRLQAAQIAQQELGQAIDDIALYAMNVGFNVESTVKIL